MPGSRRSRECPDRLFYRAADGEIGIVLRDGGSSFVTMLYCPFCSQKLPFTGDDETLTARRRPTAPNRLR